MKKQKGFICILLVIIQCMVLFVSCNPKENNTESGVASGETATGENAAVMKYSELQSVYKGEAVRSDTVERKSVTLGKKYSISIAASDKQPDDGKKLTDGIYSPSRTIFTEPELDNYVGIKSSEEFSIIIDLGGLTTDICDFELSELRNLVSRSDVAGSVDFYISTDGTDFVMVGTSICSDKIMNQSEYVHSLKLQNTVEATHIKAVVRGLKQNYSLIDEFAAYKYIPGETKKPEQVSDEYYINDAVETVTAPVYWDSSEADYSKVQNLLAGKKARIYSALLLDEGVRTDYYNTKTTSANLLVNGVNGSDAYTDSQYFHFTQGYAREIIFDLEKTSTVSSFTFGCISNQEVGIGVATDIYVSVSENGKDWMNIFINKYSSGLTGRVELKGEFDSDYKARFVKFAFTLGRAHCWVDEITLTGTKKISPSAKEVVPDKEIKSIAANQYPDKNVIGAENILLTYTFKNENKQMGLNSKEELLPYVAYLDPEGKIKDTFYDGYLFLACSTVCPSGGVLWHDEKRPSISSDWIAYADDLFADGYNINALQEAVSEVKSTLGKNDFKAKVYFPIYATVPNQKNFGDVDGDGISEDFSKVENRKKVYKWWIDLLIERYRKAGYSDLDLTGFYWNDESASASSDAGETEVMEYVKEYVHELGYKFFWIPYYMSSGFAKWQESGFDAAFMQPNYMFKDNIPASRVDDTAKMTKYLGMGVEIEMDGSALNPATGMEKYRKYLSAGVEWGYMNSTKTYYQDGGPGVLYTCCNSDDLAVRSLYDDTYRYAKCKLSLEAPDVKTKEFQTTAETTVKGALEFSEENYTIITADIALSPKFGKVKVNSNGSFEYTPAAGFTGTDTFAITVTCGIGKRTVTVSVDIQ